MLAVYPYGAGRFILNTLAIRETLGTHPAAGRLLLNMIRYADRSPLGGPKGCSMAKPSTGVPRDLPAAGGGQREGSFVGNQHGPVADAVSA